MRSREIRRNHMKSLEKSPEINSSLFIYGKEPCGIKILVVHINEGTGYLNEKCLNDFE